jgi:hypothetical protein
MQSQPFPIPGILYVIRKTAYYQSCLALWPGRFGFNNYAIFGEPNSQILGFHICKLKNTEPTSDSLPSVRMKVDNMCITGLLAGLPDVFIPSFCFHTPEESGFEKEEIEPDLKRERGGGGGERKRIRLRPKDSSNRGKAARKVNTCYKESVQYSQVQWFLNSSLGSLNFILLILGANGGLETTKSIPW